MRTPILALGSLWIATLAVSPLFAAQGRDDAYWDKRWKELCQYDNFGPRLKDSSGAWIPTSKAVLSGLGVLRGEIHRVAKLFDVDPRSVAGSILAENSMNVGIADGVQDFLVKLKIAPKGKVFGKSFSFGWGQLHLDVAQAAEPLAAKLEGRKQRSETEVAEQLQTPAGAIYYVGAVLRKIQDTYKHNQIDISKNPEILATVYNLGQENARAARARAAGGKVRVNYFGFFVERNLATIEKVIGAAPAVSTAAHGAPSKVTATSISGKTTDTKNSAHAVSTKVAMVRTPTEPDEPDPKDLRRTRVLTRDLQLLQGPTTCQDETNQGQNKNDYTKVWSRVSSPTVARAKKGSRYQVLSPGIGCGLEDWSLIQTPDGAVGWVADDTLQAASEERMLAKSDCKSTVAEGCAKSVSQKAGVLKRDGGAIEVKLVGDKKQVNWKSPNIGGRCSNGTTYGGGASAPIGVPRLAREDVERLLAVIDSFKQRVLKAVNEERAKEPGLWPVPDWGYSDNPYHGITVGDTKENLQGCVDWDAAHPATTDCYVDVATFEKQLASVEIKGKPGYRDLRKIAYLGPNNVKRLVRSQAANNGQPLSTKELRQRLLNGLQLCFDLVQDDYPKSRELLKQLKELTIEAPQWALSNTLNNIAEVAKTCGYLAELGKSKTISNPQSVYLGCSLPSKDPGEAGAWLSLSGTAMQAVLQTKEDRDEVLSDKLTHSFPVNQLLPQTGFSSKPEDCSYDPLKTAALIESLIKNRCVQAVYVPDPWLVKRFESSARVLYRPFVEEDRFLVDIGKWNCGKGALK